MGKWVLLYCTWIGKEPEDDGAEDEQERYDVNGVLRGPDTTPFPLCDMRERIVCG